MDPRTSSRSLWLAPSTIGKVDCRLFGRHEFFSVVRELCENLLVFLQLCVCACAQVIAARQAHNHLVPVFDAEAS